MSRLIDADEIRKKAVPHTRGEFGGYNSNIRKWAVLVGDIDDAPTVDAVHVEELERILSTTPGLELWDYQKRGIMSAVKRLCGKEKNDG